MRRPQIRHENLAISPERQPTTDRKFRESFPSRTVFLPAGHYTQCGRAATERIGISPAKTQRAQRIRNNIYPNLAFFASWREEYPNPSVSCIGKFAQAAKTLKFAELGKFS